MSSDPHINLLSEIIPIDDSKELYNKIINDYIPLYKRTDEYTLYEDIEIGEDKYIIYIKKEDKFDITKLYCPVKYGHIIIEKNLIFGQGSGILWNNIEIKKNILQEFIQKLQVKYRCEYRIYLTTTYS